jgi:hypothetical protein
MPVPDGHFSIQVLYQCAGVERGRMNEEGREGDPAGD